MPTEPRTHGPPAGAKRDLIAETALRAFAERGYQGTKVEDVAAELAISKGSIFQHFGSKGGCSSRRSARRSSRSPRGSTRPRR